LSASSSMRMKFIGEGSSDCGTSCHRLVEQLVNDVPKPVLKPQHKENHGADVSAISHTDIPSCCLTAFMMREAVSFNDLLHTIHNSLQFLGDALVGHTCMSDSLVEAAEALCDGRVPKVWQEIAYPSNKPLAAWVSNLQQRIHIIRAWEKEKELPACFSISLMFHPQVFLTSILQSSSRSSGESLECLKLQHCVKSQYGSPGDIESAPTEGVFVHGISIVCASWDVHSQQLKDSRPGVLCSPMPVIQFIPISVHTIPLSMLRTIGTRKSLSLDTFDSGNSQSVPFSGTASGKGLANPKLRRGVRNTLAVIRARNSMAGAVSRRAGTSDALQAPSAPVQQEQYECPLYRTSKHEGSASADESTNHICNIFLPTAADPSRWILAGVSLVCEADE
jgi:hypothetical protein